MLKEKNQNQKFL